MAGSEGQAHWELATQGQGTGEDGGHVAVDWTVRESTTLDFPGVQARTVTWWAADHEPRPEETMGEEMVGGNQ